MTTRQYKLTPFIRRRKNFGGLIFAVEGDRGNFFTMKIFQSMVFKTLKLIDAQAFNRENTVIAIRHARWLESHSTFHNFVNQTWCGHVLRQKIHCKNFHITIRPYQFNFMLLRPDQPKFWQMSFNNDSLRRLVPALVSEGLDYLRIRYYTADELVNR